MQIWLDSTNVEAVRNASSLGLLYGVTTNPTLIRQSGKSVEGVLEQLLSEYEGPITAQVTATDAKSMVLQGEHWSKISPRILIKIPALQEGYKAIQALKDRAIPVMSTVIFHPHQAYFSALSGATYVAPYVTRMDKAGINSLQALEQMLAILSKHNFPTQLLAASISSIDQISQCLELGVHAVTLKEALLESFLKDNPHTQEVLPM